MDQVSKVNATVLAERNVEVCTEGGVSSNDTLAVSDEALASERASSVDHTNAEAGEVRTLVGVAAVGSTEKDVQLGRAEVEAEQGSVHGPLAVLVLTGDVRIGIGSHVQIRANLVAHSTDLGVEVLTDQRLIELSDEAAEHDAGCSFVVSSGATSRIRSG